MNYIKITKNDVANGEGVRVVLWLSGCSHHCNGCHNPQTWSPNSGVEFNYDSEKELFDALNKTYISGLTLSGGDPLNEANLRGVLNLISKIRLLFPNKTIWLYTGYTWMDCFNSALRKEIVSNCDVIVDGRYIDSQKDIRLVWRGSKNQNVIDVKKSLKKGEMVLYEISST